MIWRVLWYGFARVPVRYFPYGADRTRYHDSSYILTGCHRVTRYSDGIGASKKKKKKKIQTCKPELLWRSIVTDEFEMQNLSIQHTWLDDERYKQKQQPEAASSSLSLGSHWQSTKKNKNEPLINFEYCQ